jgi:hypothetical protein
MSRAYYGDPVRVDAVTRGALGELAATTGERVARRLFEARGNKSEVHLHEQELATICAAAAAAAVKEATRRAAVLS